MISIVIPTRNRQELLFSLLLHLDNIRSEETQIIIVDSSDLSISKLPIYSNIKIEYVHTQIKSAAIQRNIGIEKLTDLTDYLFFLDDDTFPRFDYFKRLTKILEEPDVVGASGLALNPNNNFLRQKPTGWIGLIYRLFLLDSLKDGKLLKSAINIPCRNYHGLRADAEWLIGCSAWKYKDIELTRFENDFYGASLAEDVIFSYRMSLKGRLVVDPSVILDHLEDKLGRPNESEFWKMWMLNRHRLIKVAKWGVRGLFAFWWASLGQMCINLIGGLKKREYKFNSVRGILLGASKILRESK